MIRHIVALDSRRGIAKDGAMPDWKLPTDEAYFADQTKKYGGNVLMGHKTFTEALHEKPLSDRRNYILTRSTGRIKGAQAVNDIAAFFDEWPADQDLWIIGGAELYELTLEHSDELYITEIEGDFKCDRFYPVYTQSFELEQRSDPVTEHGISYTFCIYRRLVSR